MRLTINHARNHAGAKEETIMTRYKTIPYAVCFALGLITHAWLGAQYTNSIEPTLEARARYEHCSTEYEAGTDIYYTCLTGEDY